MIPYLARLLDITMNNGTLPGDWKKATVVPIHKGGDRSLVTNYRPICKEMEHVLASYLNQVWAKNDWLYEGQHSFRPGYSCESQLITVCQDMADCLDKGDRIDANLMFLWPCIMNWPYKNTNVMHLILFFRQIFSSTCFEYQVLIFRRIQLYVSSIWYRHSVKGEWSNITKT